MQTPTKSEPMAPADPMTERLAESRMMASAFMPLAVSIDSDSSQIDSPPPGFDAFVTIKQEQAVSAINRDVAELVGRQKVALNDVLEENQRLQIQYNNLAGTFDTWSKRVQLQAQKELTLKMERVKDELNAKYSEALGERTHAHDVEILRLRSEVELQRQQLMIAKENEVATVASQLESERRAQALILKLALACFALTLLLVVALASLYLMNHDLRRESQRMASKFDALKRQASDNHAYLNGNGLKCGLVKLLKPNLPHVDLAARILLD